jgi:predicted dehydrogenase
MMLGQIGSAKHKRNIVYELPPVDDVNALKYELELFATSISTNTPPPVTGEEGRRALEVAHMILERIDQQTVKL